MKTINIGEKEYTLEFTFEAAEHKNLVQSMFNLMTGAYFVKQGNNVDDENTGAIAMVNSVSDMISDMPKIVKIAFYAGLLEHHKISEEQSYELLKQYMKENKLSFKKVFDDIKQYMEEDGFFDLSGLNEMIEEMNQTVEEIQKKTPKKPQDHKKKQTSTK